MTHDQLHSSAHLFMWNNYPELRGLFHTNFNDIKIIESTLRGITGFSIGKARGSIISKLKSIGLVKGVFDHEFLYKGTMYFFDAKIPPDTLSDEQKQFKQINELHGAKCYTYTSLEEFKEIIEGIVL